MTGTPGSGFSRQWTYRPPVPIQTSPFFASPPEPRRLLRWITDRWFALGENRLALGTFHHQMHHRYFGCNYGNLEVLWDRWFGSFHDGTEEAHARMKERRKQMAEQA